MKRTVAFSEEVCYIGFMNTKAGVVYRDENHVYLFG